MMRSASAVLLIALLVASVATSAAVTQVTGKVVDRSGAPIRNAQVRIRGTGSTGTVAVAFNGTFKVVLRAEETSVLAEVSAPGYEKRTRRLVVTNGVADAGTLTMDRSKGLTATAFVVSQSGDGKQNHLDVFVQNDGATPVAVISVRVQAARKKNTSCLDATPGLQFAIVDQLWAGRVAAQISNRKEVNADSVAANGTFLQLGCGQQQIDVMFPFSFSLNSGERTKLRVVVPSVLRSTQRKEPFIVQLDEFALVSMTLKPEQGPAVAVKREVVIPEDTL